MYKNIVKLSYAHGRKILKIYFYNYKIVILQYIIFNDGNFIFIIIYILPFLKCVCSLRILKWIGILFITNMGNKKKYIYLKEPP